MEKTCSACMQVFRPAFVFLSASRTTAAFRAGLKARRIRYASWEVGSTWTVIIPAARVGPRDIAGSFA